MIAIIAEKPSVGQDIARIIGATEKKDGYMAGNGYLVTWALGHLVSLAMPSAYGYGKASHEDLPMLPRTVPACGKTDQDRQRYGNGHRCRQAGSKGSLMRYSASATASSWQRMQGVRENLSSDTSTTTSDIPSPSSVFGSPHSRTRLSVQV